MKKLLLNKLVIKKVESSTTHLDENLYSICDFCGCKFLFLPQLFDLYNNSDENSMFCPFCLRHNHIDNSVFLFSFCNIFEIICFKQRKQLKSIIKNIFLIGNSYPFLSYNPDNDYWAINVCHESLSDNQEALILESITHMFDVFKSLNNSIYLNLRYIKSELIEEIYLFIKTKKIKRKIFKGSFFS